MNYQPLLLLSGYHTLTFLRLPRNVAIDAEIDRVWYSVVLNHERRDFVLLEAFCPALQVAHELGLEDVVPPCRIVHRARDESQFLQCSRRSPLPCHPAARHVILLLSFLLLPSITAPGGVITTRVAQSFNQSNVAFRTPCPDHNSFKADVDGVPVTQYFQLHFPFLYHELSHFFTCLVQLVLHIRRLLLQCQDLPDELFLSLMKRTKRNENEIGAHVCICACGPSLLCLTIVCCTNCIRVTALAEPMTSSPHTDSIHHFAIKTAHDDGRMNQWRQQLQMSGNLRQDRSRTTTTRKRGRNSIQNVRTISLLSTRNSFISCMTRTLRLSPTNHGKR